MANISGISAFPESDNLLNWVGTIAGASGTVRSRYSQVSFMGVLISLKTGLRGLDLQA
jgi:hypothetical protein